MPKRKAGPLEPSYRPPLWERSQIRARSPKRRELFVTRQEERRGLFVTVSRPYLCQPTDEPERLRLTADVW